MAATAAGDNRDLRPARGGHAIEVLPTPGNALPALGFHTIAAILIFLAASEEPHEPRRRHAEISVMNQ